MLWTGFVYALITNKGFWGETTCRMIMNCVLSLKIQRWGCWCFGGGRRRRRSCEKPIQAVSRRATHGRWERDRRSSEEADVDGLSPKLFESDRREQLLWTHGSYNFHNIQTDKLFVVPLLNKSSLSRKVSLEVTCSTYFTIISGASVNDVTTRICQCSRKIVFRWLHWTY